MACVVAAGFANASGGESVVPSGNDRGPSANAIELIDRAVLAYMDGNVGEVERLLSKLREADGGRARCSGLRMMVRGAMAERNEEDVLRLLSRAVQDCPADMLPAGGCIVVARSMPELCDTLIALCGSRKPEGEGVASWLLGRATVRNLCGKKYSEEDIRKTARLWALEDFGSNAGSYLEYEYHVAAFTVHYTVDLTRSQQHSVEAARALCRLSSNSEEWVTRM